MSSQEKKIVIIGSQSSPATIKTIFLSLSSAQWVYCGKEVPYSFQLDEILGTEKKVMIGRDLQDIAKKFRQEYIDFIGKISCSLKHNLKNYLWFLSSISEKNPFISNVYLYFCYVKICKKIVDNNDTDLLIISEDPALSQAIFSYLNPNKNHDVYLKDRIDTNHLKIVEQWIEFTTKKTWFIAITFYKKILAKSFSILKRKQRIKNLGKELICIHSFTDNRSIKNTTDYQQVYFGNLGPDLLKKTNIPFFYLIDVLPTTSYFTVIRNLLRFSEDTYLCEEFITISEIFQACYAVNSRTFPLDSGQLMDDVLMDHILNAETERDRISTRREEAYLRFFIGKRIAQEIHIASFLYIFENHIWEKMFCMAFRSKSPMTRLIGYAHTVVNRMYLCYTISACEKEMLPFPDTIIVNGINAKNTLEKSGFSPNMIAVTGAMRYEHLKQKSFLKKTHAKTVVLVALSAGINDSVELVYKIIKSLGGREDFVILLKCHPTTPFRIISRYFQGIPQNIRICEESIELLLEKSDILLHSGSATCIQALADGIPVIFVNSDYRIDMNILEDIPGILSVSTPDQIYKATKDVLSPESLDQYKRAQKVIGEIFAPINKDGIHLILKE